MIIARSIALIIAVAAASGAQSPPSTDIYLAPLSMVNGRPVVGTPVNITQRPGYDNQPSFTPDSRAILFTSIHDDAQADIYRYDLASKAITRVTATAESEYSATVMPDQARFSVIRVERDSAQRLWSFALDGSDPKIVLQSLKPAGYHTWIDDDELALFVLGRPNALVHAEVRSGRADTLARDIGRSLARVPGLRGFSYVARVADSTMMLRTMAWPSKTVHDVVVLPRGTEDVAWLSRDLVLSASGSKLIAFQTGATAWFDVADLAAAGLTRISRLAVSPDGRWLAIVAIPAS
jgi:hypothetical protein